MLPIVSIDLHIHISTEVTSEQIDALFSRIAKHLFLMNKQIDINLLERFLKDHSCWIYSNVRGSIQKSCGSSSVKAPKDKQTH